MKDLGHKQSATKRSSAKRGAPKRAVSEARLFDCGKRTRVDLRDLGRSMRAIAPRRSHGDWQVGPSRPDSLDILRGQEKGRVEELIPIRYGRMLVSPFTCYRGSAAVMASDLSETPTTGINVQACGDAHANNFGGYASPERRVVFDINDFDETLPAPWEYDVKRLAASILLDAREHGYNDDIGVNSVRKTIRRYCDVIRTLSCATTLDIHFAHVESGRLLEDTADPQLADEVRTYVERARKRTHAHAFRKLVTEVDGHYRFVEDPPLLVRLSNEMIDTLHDMFNAYRDTLPIHRRRVLEQFRFRDAARRVVGVGSVGLRAYVVLLEGRGDPDPLFIQIKEAVSSVLTPIAGESGYENHGQRVVVGQRLMQATGDPFLGWARFDGRDVYVRQFRDMKSRTDQAFSVKGFHFGSALLGGTLARAHARSVDPAILDGYLGSGKTFTEAVAAFSVSYADQAERDFKRLREAVNDGVLSASTG